MNEPFQKFAEENDLSEVEPGEYTNNDAGRAKQFVDCHKHQIRFVHAFRRWLVWDENHWRTDNDGAITRLAVENSKRLLSDANELKDEHKRIEGCKQALALGNSQVIDRMLEIAQCDERIVVSHNDLDAEKFLLGVGNGVVDLTDGEFRGGKREDLITKRAGTHYDADAKCPQWEKFLFEVMNGDLELIAYVQKLVGYTLTGDVTQQCFLFLFGGGKNGKSVFTETLQKLLGGYGQRAPQSLLTASHAGREPTNEIARLHGARLVISSETEEGSRLAESRVKDLTGGDTLTGRFLYKEPFDFKPQFKLWMFGNHKPEIRGQDDGVWRRVRLIPFTVQIEESKRNPHLAQHLAEELPGILQWAIEGVNQWLGEGLRPPKAVVEASAEYRTDEDTLGEFIEGELEPSPNERTEVSAIFARYQVWATQTGVRFQYTQRVLTSKLKERPGMSTVKSNGSNYFVGWTLQ